MGESLEATLGVSDGGESHRSAYQLIQCSSRHPAEISFSLNILTEASRPHDDVIAGLKKGESCRQIRGGDIQVGIDIEDVAALAPHDAFFYCGSFALVPG